MSAKSNVKTDNQRDQLIAMLMSNNTSAAPVQQPDLKERAMQFMTDAAATSLDTTAAIAGALTGAFGNAKQVFQMEAKFRAAERGVRAHRMAAQYADRLAKLAQ